MELGIILYWIIFYSLLAGWYSRTAQIIRRNKSIDFKRYIIPRILLAHVMASYSLVLVFYFLSLLSENTWALSFMAVAVLGSAEYFWIRLGEARAKLIKLLTVKIGLFVLAMIIAFYFSSASSTHLELLTKVSPGIFGPFEKLLTIILSSVAWIVLTQLSLTALSLIYIVRLIIRKDDYIENFLFVFFSAISSCLFLVLAAKSIFDDAIPYVINNQFVPNMYHPNKGLDGTLICKNREPDEQIILLPSGGISVATLNNKKQWVFTVDACELNNE